MQHGGPRPGMQEVSRFWCVASLLFGAVALLKGLRVPGGWALAQLQITYIHGFVKRGLLGEALYLAHVRAKHMLEALCLLELAVLAGLLVVFTFKSGLLQQRGSPAIVAAFAGSYATTFLAHMVGYQDTVLYALSLCVVLVRDLNRRFYLAVPVCLASLLTHENFLCTAMPVILFSFLLDCPRDGTHRGAKMAAVLLGFGLVVLFGIALSPSFSPQELQSFTRDTLARAAYPVDARVLGVVGLSFTDNLKLNLHVISHNWWWWAEGCVALLTLGPLCALMIYRASASVQGWRAATFLLASLSPLLLNFIGWDNVRWSTLCALSTYLNLGLLHRSIPEEMRKTASLREQQAAILVLGLGLASGHGLMDGEKGNPYPFFTPAIRPAVIRHDGALGQVL